MIIVIHAETVIPFTHRPPLPPHKTGQENLDSFELITHLQQANRR